MNKSSWIHLNRVELTSNGRTSSHICLHVCTYSLLAACSMMQGHTRKALNHQTQYRTLVLNLTAPLSIAPITMIPCIVPCGRGRDITPTSHLPTPFQRAPGLQINARVDWRRVRRLEARPPHFLHHVETGVQADVAALFAIGRREAVILQGGEGVLVKAAISARQQHVRKRREVK